MNEEVHRSAGIDINVFGRDLTIFSQTKLCALCVKGEAGPYEVAKAAGQLV
jgi:hypothetical protein